MSDRDEGLRDAEVANAPSPDERIPARFRADIVARIGHGGEAVAYELNGGRVLRLYHEPPRDFDALAAFYAELSASRTDWVIPAVLDRGQTGAVFWSVHRLVPGRALIDVLPELRGADRKRALDAYLDAAEVVGSLPVARTAYSEPLPEDAPLECETWTAYLRARVAREVARTGVDLRRDLPQLDSVLAELDRRIERLPERPPPVLVHGDYFPGNVIIGDDLRVTGLIDFGPLTAIGDAMMDVASAAIFLEVQRSWEPADIAYVSERLIAQHGAAGPIAISAYRPWYAMRLAHCRDDDERLYAWCLDALRALIPS